jgi:hypothetical protein
VNILDKCLWTANKGGPPGPWNWIDSLEQPRQWKVDMRFGMWNVRSL